MLQVFWRKCMLGCALLGVLAAALVCNPSLANAAAAVPQSSCVWKTVALGDANNGGFHMHTQLQAMYDSATGAFCDRIIGNVYLDVDPSFCCNPAGTLRAFVIDLTTDQTLHTTSCNVPSVPSNSTNCGRFPGAPFKYEAGGPGNSIASPRTGDVVYVYGRYDNVDGFAQATNTFMIPA